MCARNLTDIYTLSPRARGPRALSVHIGQIPRTHGITIKYKVITNNEQAIQAYIFNSCNTNTSALPDMHTQRPRVHSAQGECGHTRKCKSTCFSITISVF